MKKIVIIAVLFITAAISRAQVGICTNAPTSTLDVRGSLSAAIRLFSSATNISDTDHCIIFNGSSACTATLPDASTCKGRFYIIKNGIVTVPVPVLTISATASQNIDGQSSWVLDEPNEAVYLTSNGANWIVNSQSVPVAKTSLTGGQWNEGGNTVSSSKAIGNISNFDLPFITNNTEWMRITANGNIGMGITNPTYKLQVMSVADPLFLGGVQPGSVTDSILTIESGVVKKMAVSSLVSVSTNFWGLNGNVSTDPATTFLGTTDNNSLRLRTNNIQRMIIDSLGKIGIGTATPGNLVELNSGNAGLSGLRLSQMTTGSVLFVNTQGDVTENNGNLNYDEANNRLSVGAGTTPNSTLTVGGAVAFPVATKTANYTLTSTDYTILCNSTAGGFTLTLPPAATAQGRIYVIKKASADGNLIMVKGNTSSELIDGSVNQYLYAPWSYMTIQSDGVSSWMIIGQH